MQAELPLTRYESVCFRSVQDKLVPAICDRHHLLLALSVVIAELTFLASLHRGDNLRQVSVERMMERVGDPQRSHFFGLQIFCQNIVLGVLLCRFELLRGSLDCVGCLSRR
jgi:hypothetical protein